MKPTQRTTELLLGEASRAHADKKPATAMSSAPALMVPGVPGVESTKLGPAFGVPPTPAVWNRYIDSRMKQFGTR